MSFRISKKTCCLTELKKVMDKLHIPKEVLIDLLFAVPVIDSSDEGEEMKKLLRKKEKLF